MRTYRVVFSDAEGNRYTTTVRASNEADAILAAKHDYLTTKGGKFGLHKRDKKWTSKMAVPVTKE